MASLRIRSTRVVFVDDVRPAVVTIQDGLIAAIDEDSGGDRGSESIVDLGSVALLPGLVDTHVHINEPGRTAWEGFDTATAAAAAGGVTTVIDMPLNCQPPTTTVAALREKQRVAQGRCHIDVGFWGGQVPGNDADLAALHEAGVFGFKAFLADSGVSEFPPVSADQLTRAMARLPALFVVHAEDPGGLRTLAPTRRYADFLGSRPAAAEASAVRAVVTALGKASRAMPAARAHILHLSDALVSRRLIAAARRGGARLTAETCPHYLTLSADEVAPGATEFKCCPPIRESGNRDELWAALAAGDIDCVVSDHSPCVPEMKGLPDGDFAAAWGGIASIQLGLPVVWTAAAGRGFTLADVAQWMARRPARLVGLSTKGTIRVGADADLVAFDPDAWFTVRPELLRQRHPVTPYLGRRLRGVVKRTWLRGEVVDGVSARGRLLVRKVQ